MRTLLCQEQNLKVGPQILLERILQRNAIQLPPGVNEKPLAWHFHARQFQNFYFWQSVTFCNIQFWSNGVPLIDCLKTIEIFWRARQTVSEYPRFHGFRFVWTNIHPCPNPSSSLNKNLTAQTISRHWGKLPGFLWFCPEFLWFSVSSERYWAVCQTAK